MKLKDKPAKQDLPGFMKRKVSVINKSTNIKPAKSIHTGHRERLKEQYLNNGIHSMTEIQQLELLLFYSIPQKDTNPIAHALLSRFGSIKEVLMANFSDLVQVEGVKDNTALFLKLVNNMTTICNLPDDKDSISSSKDAKDYCSKLYIGVKVEQFYVICLSKSNKILGVKLIDSGTADEINVQIRKITEFAIAKHSNRIIISHNHPFGEGKMSDEDCRFTYSVVCSCLLNSIDILDHLIVGNNRVYSLAENNVIQKLKARAFDKVKISSEVKALISSSSSEYILSETFDTNVTFND